MMAAETIEAVFDHPNIRYAEISLYSRRMYRFCVKHLVDLKPSLDIEFRYESGYEKEVVLDKKGIRKLEELRQRLKTQYHPQ
jgi:hypothetical protein